MLLVFCRLMSYSCKLNSRYLRHLFCSTIVSNNRHLSVLSYLIAISSSFNCRLHLPILSCGSSLELYYLVLIDILGYVYRSVKQCCLHYMVLWSALLSCLYQIVCLTSVDMISYHAASRLHRVLLYAVSNICLEIIIHFFGGLLSQYVSDLCAWNCLIAGFSIVCLDPVDRIVSHDASRSFAYRLKFLS